MSDDKRWEISPKVLEMIREGGKKFRGLIDRERYARYHSQKEEKAQ